MFGRTTAAKSVNARSTEADNSDVENEPASKINIRANSELSVYDNLEDFNKNKAVDSVSNAALREVDTASNAENIDAAPITSSAANENAATAKEGSDNEGIDAMRTDIVKLFTVLPMEEVELIYLESDHSTKSQAGSEMSACQQTGSDDNYGGNYFMINPVYLSTPAVFEEINLNEVVSEGAEAVGASNVSETEENTMMTSCKGDARRDESLCCIILSHPVCIAIGGVVILFIVFLILVFMFTYFYLKYQSI